MKKYKYQTSFMHNGKRYMVRADTLEELYVKKAKKKEQVEKTVIIYDERTTVDQWAEIVFDTYKRKTPGLSDTKNRYHKYISPVIGYKALISVRDVECQNILNNCAGLNCMS